MREDRHRFAQVGRLLAAGHGRGGRGEAAGRLAGEMLATGGGSYLDRAEDRDANWLQEMVSQSSLAAGQLDNMERDSALQTVNDASAPADGSQRSSGRPGPRRGVGAARSGAGPPGRQHCPTGTAQQTGMGAGNQTRRGPWTSGNSILHGCKRGDKMQYRCITDLCRLVMGGRGGWPRRRHGWRVCYHWGSAHQAPTRPPYQGCWARE